MDMHLYQVKGGKNLPIACSRARDTIGEPMVGKDPVEGFTWEIKKKVAPSIHERSRAVLCNPSPCPLPLQGEGFSRASRGGTGAVWILPIGEGK